MAKKGCEVCGGQGYLGVFSATHGQICPACTREANGGHGLDDIMVIYTNSDDGVWLECRSCNWQACVGFFATVEHVVETAKAHKMNILIEASSLGTPEAKAIRARTPPEVVEEIMERIRKENP